MIYIESLKVMAKERHQRREAGNADLCNQMDSAATPVAYPADYRRSQKQLKQVHISSLFFLLLKESRGYILII